MSAHLSERHYALGYLIMALIVQIHTRPRHSLLLLDPLTLLLLSLFWLLRIITKPLIIFSIIYAILSLFELQDLLDTNDMRVCTPVFSFQGPKNRLEVEE